MLVVVEREDDPVLIIDPDRSLIRPAPFSLLVVQALQVPQVSFIARRFKLDQFHPSHSDDRNRQSEPVSLVGAYAGQIIIGKLDFHKESYYSGDFMASMAD